MLADGQPEGKKKTMKQHFGVSHVPLSPAVRAGDFVFVSGQVPVGEIQRDLIELGAPLRASRSDRLGWLAARDAIGLDAKRRKACL